MSTIPLRVAAVVVVVVVVMIVMILNNNTNTEYRSRHRRDERSTARDTGRYESKQTNKQTNIERVCWLCWSNFSSVDLERVAVRGTGTWELLVKFVEWSFGVDFPLAWICHWTDLYRLQTPLLPVDFDGRPAIPILIFRVFRFSSKAKAKIGYGIVPENFCYTSSSQH